MLTVADLLAAGIGLPPVAEPAHDLPPGSSCAITGQAITRGYRVADMVTDATSEFLDTFGGRPDGYVSESAARCFRSANPRAGNPCARGHLAIDVGSDGVLYVSPMISCESAAKQGRPCWSAAVRAVWPQHAGRPCCVMIVDDFKRRLWPYATVGALGSQTAVYVHDGGLFGMESTIRVDWPAMLACLDAVEAVYALGFSKPAIRDGLLHSTKAVAAVGLPAAIAHERAIAGWRARPEFRPALMIAQLPAAGEGGMP